MENLLRIWVVTDGRAGNFAQAMGLAEAIDRRRPCEITNKQITLKPWAQRIPPALAWRLGARQNGWPFSGLATGRSDLAWPWPDLIVGAGRRCAPIVAAMRKLHGVPTVQLLSPQMPATAFDAVVVPHHDALTGGNVLYTTGALNRITPSSIAAAGAGDDWADRFSTLPRPRVAVMIGGPSKSSQFRTDDCNRLITALSALQQDRAPDREQGHGLIITPSRRTPADLVQHLATLGPNSWVWQGDGANPYPAMLDHADAALVTEDSVNMASEAASAGLPVHVFPVSKPAPKITRFHETLAQQGASRRFVGRIESWAYPPLAEADRIADDLFRRGVVDPPPD